MDFKYDILKHPNVALTTDGSGEAYKHGKQRYNYASIQFDRDLLDSNAKETEFADDNSDYVILTEEDIDRILNPQGSNEINETEESLYEDIENFNASQKSAKYHHVPPHTRKS